MDIIEKIGDTITEKGKVAADKAKNSNKAFQKNIFKFSTQHFHESTSTIRTGDESTVNHRSQSVI